MLYAIFCYNSEQVVSSWSEEKDKAVMAHHASVLQKFATQRKVGPVVRLMPTTTATTVRAGRQPIIIDGPFAETKEQLLGFYLVNVDTLEEALEIAAELGLEPGAMEVRPVQFYSDLSNPATDFGREEPASPAGQKRQVP